MSEAKYTWKWVNGQLCILENKYQIAQVHSVGSDAHQEEIGRMLSAAPKLLAALEGCLGYIADLNGCAWISGDGPGERDMRQRAKALQAIAFAAINEAKGV